MKYRWPNVLLVCRSRLSYIVVGTVRSSSNSSNCFWGSAFYAYSFHIYSPSSPFILFISFSSSLHLQNRSISDVLRPTKASPASVSVQFRFQLAFPVSGFCLCLFQFLLHFYIFFGLLCPWNVVLFLRSELKSSLRSDWPDHPHLPSLPHPSISSLLS